MHPLPRPRHPPAHAVTARHHSPVNTAPTALGRGSWRGLSPPRGHYWWGGGGKWGGGHRFVIISFVESTDFPVIGFRNTRVLRGAGVRVCGGDMGEPALGWGGEGPQSAPLGHCWLLSPREVAPRGQAMAPREGRGRGGDAGNAAAGLFLQPGASATKKPQKTQRMRCRQFPGQPKIQSRPGSREELAPKQPPAAPPLHGESGEGDRENRGDVLG